MPTQSVLGLGARAFRGYGAATTTTTTSTTTTTPPTIPLVYLDASIPASYGGSGSTWYDLSGNNNHVTLYNMSYTTDLGGGFVCNGSTSSAYDFSKTLDFPNNAFSICTWVKHYSTSPFYQRYLSLANENGVLRLQGGSYEMYVRSSGTLQFLVAGSAPLNTAQHVCGIWTGTTLQIYVNGTLVGQNTVGGSMIENDLTFLISANSESINGVIYNMMVYDVALSSSPVSQFYTSTSR